MQATRPRKPQERAAVTRDLILQAAERLFARVGYEKAQVDEIAEAAGFSKGALYAHFKSKEDLFVSLIRAKAAVFQAKLRRGLDAAQSRERKVAAFRRFYVDLAGERDWALILLEAKLFIARHPEAATRLRWIDEHLGDSIEQALIELFGPSSRAAGEALGGIVSALVLEAELEPGVISPRQVRTMLGTVFDSLLGLNGG